MTETKSTTNTQKAIESLAADREALLKIAACPQRHRVAGRERLPGLVRARCGGAPRCPLLGRGRPFGAGAARRAGPVRPPDRARAGRAGPARRSWTRPRSWPTTSRSAPGPSPPWKAWPTRSSSCRWATSGPTPPRCIASAFAFDHFLHIRSDLFAPRGPLTGAPPPSDELHSGPRSTGSRPPSPNRTRRRWRASKPPSRSISMGRGPASSDWAPVRRPAMYGRHRLVRPLGHPAHDLGGGRGRLVGPRGGSGDHPVVAGLLIRPAGPRGHFAGDWRWLHRGSVHGVGGSRGAGMGVSCTPGPAASHP